jgi:ABC-type phosphate transport system auxiliary subunit
MADIVTTCSFLIGSIIGLAGGMVIGQWLIGQGIIISFIAVIGSMFLIMISHYWFLAPVMDEQTKKEL